jgi:hypothetical protein
LAVIRDETENLEMALSSCRDALQIYTEESYPIYHEEAQRDLESIEAAILRS